MHVLLFFTTVALCLALIFLLQWMITLDNKQNTWALRRTTFQPELFDQDAEEVKE